MANALLEERHAVGDLVVGHGDGRHVEVAEMNAELNAVGVRDHQVPRVVLTKALHRELPADRLERLQHRRPVLRIAEPELGVLFVFELVPEKLKIDGYSASQPSAPGGTASSDGLGKDFRTCVLLHGGSTVGDIGKRKDGVWRDPGSDRVLRVGYANPQDGGETAEMIGVADVAGLVEWTVSGRAWSSSRFAPSGRFRSSAHSMSCGHP